MNTDRYSRQILFPGLGLEGQARLLNARVAVIGCGALGTNAIQSLVRGGVGYIRAIDRDIVEITNLHRQVLYDEQDARAMTPKASAVARRARAINSEVVVEARVADITPRNIRTLLDGVDLILDGTDNVETRYLLNDYAVAERKPWIYAGAVGSTATCAAFLPGGPCLRCLWPESPPPGALPTCDTAGVLPSAPAVAAAMQAAAAMRILAGQGGTLEPRVMQIDGWKSETASVRVRKNPACPACVQKKFDFLDARAVSSSEKPCGRRAVQITPPPGVSVDMDSLAARLSAACKVRKTEYYIEASAEDFVFFIFEDGRVLVKGTDDPARARSLVARYIGF